ncbi:hypothetical protein QVD17_29794 [Tagetes erecta]|uniref:Secreted protein n=1 Tax=Tagetes erecta TaxID=13708 RepID=A0AAD8K475_TARER|nr:hypothetical protein QVD17_29794 [Tagetes erecta]
MNRHRRCNPLHHNKAITFILLLLQIFEASSKALRFPGRFYAFEKAHRLDPTSTGHGVCQFKTVLLQRLERVVLSLCCWFLPIANKWLLLI